MIPDEDQLALRETVRRFARECLLPGYQKREAEGRLDRALVREMGHMGLLAADVPERLGGMGLDGVTVGMIAEELAYGDFNLAGLSVEMSLLAAIITRSAPAHIVDEWVPRMTRGEAIVAICVTEPRGGSDASNLQMRARRDGDDFILNGEKTSISFADTADAFLVFARSGPADSGARGITAFFVPGDAPGIHRTRFSDVGCRIQGRG